MKLVCKIHKEGICYDCLQNGCAGSAEEGRYSADRFLNEKLLSESTIQKLRQGEMVAISNLEIICTLLHLQPGDVIGML